MSLGAVGARFVACSRFENSSACEVGAGDAGFLIGLVVEAILFGLFTCCMMLDQWEVVTTGMTQIDRLKGMTPADYASDGPGVNEVFGGEWSQPVTWRRRFCPEAVVFPASVRDEVVGYCRPCYDDREEGEVKETDDDKKGEIEIKGVEIV